MKVFKLTNGNWQTKNNTKWGPGVTHTADGSGELCGPGWLHFYYSAELAALLSPIHVNYSPFVLWSAKTGRKVLSDCGLKGGTTKLTTLEIIPLPVYAANQRVAFAIYCALHVCDNPQFTFWANQWLKRADRSIEAAKTMENTAYRLQSVTDDWRVWTAVGWASHAAVEAGQARAIQKRIAFCGETGDDQSVYLVREANLYYNQAAIASASAADIAAHEVNHSKAGDFSFLQAAALKAAAFDK